MISENKIFNLKHKKAREQHIVKSVFDSEQEVRKLLKTGEFKAVTVCFSDIEGRLHMLDYDADHLLRSANNLTFDGSSIRGFTKQYESDLIIRLDWRASYLLPGEMFGFGKIFMFGEILDKDRSSYHGDIRLILRKYLKSLHPKEINIAAEIEGFLFKGKNQEKIYNQNRKFEYVTSGGYFNTLPGSPLRTYIDEVAEIQRLAGFENEKDHPEVAPSQFEINWKYTDALIAADQIQLYKMICRQVADRNNSTACFLPKPIVGVNGNGMHINISISDKSKNIFYKEGAEDNLSPIAHSFIMRVLKRAPEICLALNSSVNAYRRLDPNFEAPNRIKASSVDRGSMIRIPIGNENSARIEVRTVAPDANPYLAILAILKAGLSDLSGVEHFPNIQFLPDNIYTAINYFEESKLMHNAMGNEAHSKYIMWKREAADRCPRKLGTNIKAGEVMFHHEVTNQQLWNIF